MAEGNQGSQSTGDETVNNTNSNQDTQPKWIDQLPENLRGNEKLTRFERIQDLGTAFLDLDGKYEKDIRELVKIPGEDATDEDRATFFTKLGRPEKPEDYEITETSWPEEADKLIKDSAKEEIDSFRAILNKYS